MKRKILVQNRKARFNFHLEERHEAGIQLLGSEVKSLREGRGSLVDAYVVARGGELWLIGAHIAEYSNASHFNHDPYRDRKLLMHRREILRLASKSEAKGYTIVPVSIYLNERNIIKVEIALARGKKSYDRREEIKKRDEERMRRRGDW